MGLKRPCYYFKAKCMSTLRTYSNLYINNKCIQYVDSAKHLGHLLDNSVESILDVNYISGIFTKSVNILMADLGSVPSGILIKLFSQYCCSLYGIGLCDIRSNEVNKLNIQWRKALRRIIKLPSRCHNNILNVSCNYHTLDIVIIKRIVNFFYNMIHSDNMLFRSLANRCLSQCISNMGKNIVHINKLCNICVLLESRIQIETIIGKIE